MVVALLVAIQPCQTTVTPAVPSRATRKITNIGIFSFNLGNTLVAIALMMPTKKAVTLETMELMRMLGVVGIAPTQRHMLIMYIHYTIFTYGGKCL